MAETPYWNGEKWTTESLAASEERADEEMKTWYELDRTTRKDRGLVVPPETVDRNEINEEPDVIGRVGPTRIGEEPKRSADVLEGHLIDAVEKYEGDELRREVDKIVVQALRSLGYGRPAEIFDAVSKGDVR